MMELAHQSGAEWGSLTIEFAIKNNHFDCLQYAFEHGAEQADPGGFDIWDIDGDYARSEIGMVARNGNFAMLKYIVEVMKREIGDRDFDDEGDTEECDAAESGSLECLKYIHSLLDAKGYPFLGKACIDAARYGHLSCLQYVVENAKMTLKEGRDTFQSVCRSENTQTLYLSLIHI